MTKNIAHTDKPVHTELANKTLPLARPLPANLEAERFVLGECAESAAILDAVIAAGLREEHFTVGDHRRICRSLIDMRSKKIPIDLCSLGEHLGADCGPLLADLVFGVVLHIPHALNHLNILEEKRRLRGLLHIADQINAEAREVSADSRDIYSRVMQGLRDLGITA